MNSSRRQTDLHAPMPPAGTRAGAAYTRFIPREELQGFASWTPDAFAEAPFIAQPVQPGTPGAPVRAARSGEAPASAPLPPWPRSQAFGESSAAPTRLSPKSTQSAAQSATADFTAAPPQARQAPAPAEPPPDTGLQLEAQRAQMQAEMDRQVAAARQQGYQDGYRDGLVALESFKESFATQTSGQMAQVLQTLDKDLGQLEQQLATSVARVATELARQVVRSELVTRPTLVADVAREAINAVLMSARHITVQVNPDDHALVARGCEEALAARGARLLAHPGISRGGCRVESDVGVIDAAIATRWAQATQPLGTGVAWQDDDDVLDLADGGGDA
jgi:flagellar assembly protein FliH